MMLRYSNCRLWAVMNCIAELDGEEILNTDQVIDSVWDGVCMKTECASCKFHTTRWPRFSKEIPDDI